MEIMESRVEKLKEFLKEQSNDSFLKYALALEYVRLNEDNTARDCFLKLIKEDEDYVASYYQLGKLYESQKEVEKALDIYKRGIFIAQKMKNTKTILELKEAYNMLLEIDEDQV
jgi:Tfp pilus assembly protein PilF